MILSDKFKNKLRYYSLRAHFPCYPKEFKRTYDYIS